VLKGDIKSSRN